MRNELAASGRRNRRERGCWKRQEFFALMIGGDGEMIQCRKSFFVCQLLRGRLDGKKSGNEGLGDMELRWSPPGVAREPIMPTKALMPAGRHGVDEEEAWPPAEPEPMEAPQHIVGESRAVQVRRRDRPATSTDRIDPRTMGFRSNRGRRGKRRRTRLPRRAR